MKFTLIHLARAKVAELTLKHSNFPRKYVEDLMQEVQYKAPKLPNYRQITKIRVKNYFDLYRPWSLEFQSDNVETERKRKIWVQPIKDWNVFRGDRVEILTGKDKGKQGLVCEIIQERNWVFVKGLNMYIRKIQKRGIIPESYLKVEAPLMVTTDIALVDPEDLKPVTVSWRYTETGEKVRTSDRTGRIIPIPILEEETPDYVTKNTYLERKKDTTAKEVTRITFVPSLQTFEMDLMKQYGIEEDRIPKKCYWY